MPDNRFIKFDNAYNFREIGGLNCEGGKRIKTGILFRSDDLASLSRRDRQKLNRLNINLIIDLRGIKERERKPDRLPSGLETRVINIPIDHSSQALKQKQFLLFLIQQSKEFDFEDYLRGHYFNTAFESTGEIKKIVTLLAGNNNLPALIHCTVGKDRTGFIAAIIQLLAGVPRSVVAEEYLSTNRFIGPRINRIIFMIRILSFFRASIEQIRPMLEVRPVYLNSVLDEILRRYGTVENYLIECCGVEPDTIEKLRSRILE